MIYKKLTLLFVMILLVTTVSAGSFVFQRDTNVNMKVPTFNNNNSIADGTVNCFITIRYPNESLLRNDTQMGFNIEGEKQFNVSLTNTELNANGEYPSAMRCNNGADFGFSVFSFEVNPTGKEFSTAQGILYFVMFGFALTLFFITLFGAIKVPFDNPRDEEMQIVGTSDLKYVKIVLWFICYLIAIWVMALATNITDSFLFFNGAANFFNAFYVILLALLLPTIVIFFIAIIMRVIDDRKINKLLEDGFRVE